jgi:hypothetical protein
MTSPTTSPRRRFALVACLLAGSLLAGSGLAACGGGGGATPVPQTSLPVVDLGTLPSTTPTRSEVRFDNPLATTAAVSVSVTPSPFAPAPDGIPAEVAAGETAAFDVVFDPLRPGVASTTLTVRFEGGGQVDEQAYTLRANAEPVMFFVSPTTLDFGGVVLGQSPTREVSFTNLANLSTVTFTRAQVPHTAFSVVGDPFPLTLPPGETGTLTLRYTPETEGIHDGTLRIGPSDPGGPVTIGVMAEGLDVGSEIVTEYGSVTLDASGVTPLLSVSVPADGVSLYLEGDMSGGSIPNEIGLHTLTGPGGKVYENASSLGAYVWIPGWDVFSTLVPNTDRTATQLVPGGGTYTFQLRLLQGVGSTMRVRAVVERRKSGRETKAVLPLNIFLANGLAATAATATADATLQGVLARMDGILSAQGIRLGDVAYYDIADASFDAVETESEFRQLLALSAAATDTRLNLFFVKKTFGGTVLGVAATVAGPKLNGTTMSGVMSSYEGFTGDTIGRIAAHEVGHFVGLEHTAEQNGTHDNIGDTANCPSTGTSATCPTPGGGYLMHWQSVSGTTISDGQGMVIRGHPCMEPDFNVSKPAPGTILQDMQALSEMETLPEGWCATCERLRAQGRLPKNAAD